MYKEYSVALTGREDETWHGKSHNTKELSKKSSVKHT
jgi:hypothetical protein